MLQSSTHSPQLSTVLPNIQFASSTSSSSQNILILLNFPQLNKHQNQAANAFSSGGPGAVAPISCSAPFAYRFRKQLNRNLNGVPQLLPFYQRDSKTDRWKSAARSRHLPPRRCCCCRRQQQRHSILKQQPLESGTRRTDHSADEDFILGRLFFSHTTTIRGGWGQMHHGKQKSCTVRNGISLTSL